MLIVQDEEPEGKTENTLEREHKQAKPKVWYLYLIQCCCFAQLWTSIKGDMQRYITKFMKSNF